MEHTPQEIIASKIDTSHINLDTKQIDERTFLCIITFI